MGQSSQTVHIDENPLTEGGSSGNDFYSYSIIKENLLLQKYICKWYKPCWVLVETQPL